MNLRPLDGRDAAVPGCPGAVEDCPGAVEECPGAGAGLGTIADCPGSWNDCSGLDGCEAVPAADRDVDAMSDWDSVAVSEFGGGSDNSVTGCDDCWMLSVIVNEHRVAPSLFMWGISQSSRCWYLYRDT